MADKDKKKLKVILKLPPKSSSSAQPKSSPATASGGAAAGGAKPAAAANANNASSAPPFAFSSSATGLSHQSATASAGSLQQHDLQQKQQHRSSSSSGSTRNLQYGQHLGHPSRHGVLLPPGAATPAAPSGSALFHTAGSFSSVRSSGNSSVGGPAFSSSAAAPGAAGGGAGGGAAGSASVLHLSAPPGSSIHAPTPHKKRKFKTVEHAGPLGVGAVVVGRAGASGAAASSPESPGSGRDAGGGAGTTRVGGGGGGGKGTGGNGGHGGGGRDGRGKEGGGGGREVAVGGAAAGGRTGLPPAPIAPFLVKKSHKKQVKPSIQSDGPQAHNPFAGIIMPEKIPSEPLSKTMLEGVLEKLQKKDTYAVFAEPVDASQVPDYYDIIKDPMDFGTMRKKIRKGSYKTIEEFEGDIYLICGNAMRYNGLETIYYKQAKAIREMARKALDGIRAQVAGEIRNPISHKKKQSPGSKKPQAKKPTLSKVRLDGTGSDFASGATLAGDGEYPKGWSNSTLDARKVKEGPTVEKLVSFGEDSQDAWVTQPAGKEGKSETQEEPSGALLKPMGPKDGRRPLSTEEYHRNTYRQRLLPAHGRGPPLAALGGESRQLLPVGNQVDHAYTRSLAKFGVRLGPRAWPFVAARLRLLNVPGLQAGTTTDPRGEEKLTVPLPIQMGATTETHRPAGGESGGIGGDLASSPSQSGKVVDTSHNRRSGGVVQSGQVGDFTSSRPSGVPHGEQVIDSTPRVLSISSNVSQGPLSTPSNPTGVSRVVESVVFFPSHPMGGLNVGEAVVSSQNYPSGGSQVGQAVVSTSRIPPGVASQPSGLSQAAVSIPNFSFGPPHAGQTLGSNLSSSRPSDIGQGAVASLNSAGPVQVGQALGSSFSSSGPLHVVQTLPSFPVGGKIGTNDRTPVKNLQVSSLLGGASSDTQQERGNGRLDSVRVDPVSDSLVHSTGTKQILGLDSDVASEEMNSRRHGWISVSGVDQAVSSLAVGTTKKAFSQGWSATPLKHGSTSYAYAPMPSTVGRDESNAQAQAWAQARVMSLSNPAEAKRNLSRDAQVLAFLSQNREVPSDFATNRPQILQSSVYADYNSRPRQSIGLSLATPPSAQMQDQRPESFVNKPSAPEEKASGPGIQSQGNMRPASLQQSSLQQRPMPPDLNVALLSPSALQSPPPQQGSTPKGARQPDLKLQL